MGSSTHALLSISRRTAQAGWYRARLASKTLYTVESELDGPHLISIGVGKSAEHCGATAGYLADNVIASLCVYPDASVECSVIASMLASTDST